MNDLDTLRPEVREALWHIRPASRARFQLKSWETIRAELLRLAVRNAELEAKATRDHEWFNDLLTENKKAEAELAALKAAIAGSARVEVTLGCAIDGEIPPDLALCKVALVKVAE